MGPDWSLLPQELIQHISDKIPFTNIYFRIRAVCRSWRLACSLHSHHISPLPWLRLPKFPTMPVLSFYDFSRSEIHHFDLPFLVGKKRFFDSGRSWLFLEKNMVVSLLNPITGEVKTNLIPSLAAPPTILGFASNEKTRNPLPSVYHREFNYVCVITKIILTSSPFDVDCFVVAKFISEWELGFCKIGDSRWTVLKLTEYGGGSRRILDFTCKKNLVYAINDLGHITIYDLQNLSQNILIADLDCLHWYKFLLLGIEGELDGIPLAVKNIDYIMPKGRCEIYKCIYDELYREYRWERVKDIGNSMLVLDRGKCGIVSLDNARLNGLEKNHLCCYECSYEMGNYSYSIKMVSVENRTIKEVPTSFGLFSWDSVGSPAWFSPRLY
ncbi:hypothetical protein LUZ60_013998 [Juncus effusus]|nr:hypothetical protein LUZ60_013998 [Juncus effusus]